MTTSLQMGTEQNLPFFLQVCGHGKPEFFFDLLESLGK